MKGSKLLLVLAVLAVIATLVTLIVTVNKFGITGRASDIGAANLTISGAASISFTDAVCNFGSGSVDEVPTRSAIFTGNATCVDGSWTGSACDGLQVTNDGNVNISVTFASSNAAADFIGGTSPSFKWIVADGTDCVGAEGLTTLTEITGTPSACDNLSLAGTLDMDFGLHIPEDAIGTKSTVITATGTSV